MAIEGGEMSHSTFILGIDPGLANTGWGVIEVAGSKKSCLAYGCISTAAGDPIDARLKQIYDGISAVIERYHPSELGIESIFFSANAKSAIATGQARGAALVAVAGAGRKLGFVCAPAIFQRVLADCVDVPSDVEAYARNRKALTEGLSALGYEYVEPDGAFYLWVKALEPDAQAFFERAKAHELLPVPSDSFGCPGWVRIGYCVSYETIVNSMPAWEALAAEYR